MKKIIILIMTCILLFSCDSNTNPLDKKPKTKQYLENMDSYEFMEVALIGMLDESDRSLEYILNRAKEKLGLDLIEEIDSDHIIYGEQSLRFNNVYLFIPTSNMNITVGSYDSNTDDISKVYYEAKNSLPFIYVESAEIMNPKGMVKYSSDETDYTDGMMYTGIDVMNHDLRTEYRMGLVDINDINIFDAGEYLVFSQFIFDMANDFSQANYEKQIHFMGEMMIDSDMYYIFTVEDELTGDILHAINYSSEKNEFKYLVSEDGVNWVVPDLSKG